MGCRHYFVVDRLEELVDECDSRSSSLAHEHENFRLVSQLHVAIQIFWSQWPPRWTVWTNRLVVQSQRVSPFYHDLHLRFGLCLCLYMNVQQTNWYSCSHERKVYRFPEHSNGTFVLSQGVFPLYHDLVSGLIGLVGSFLLSSNVWTQFLHPIMSQGNLRRHSRWFIYFFVNDFFSFHPNNFRNTISWECIVKNDSVRSRLIELQSFLLSKFDTDPIHRVLMFLPCCMHVPCKTRCFQVDLFRILMVFVHGIHMQKEYCLSFAQIFELPVSILNWWWNANWLHIRHDKCTEEVARNNNIVL